MFDISMKSSVTFVTSFFYIYEKDYDEKKSALWRVERFREIAETGIQICIYTCPFYEQHVKNLEAEFPENVRWMKTMELNDTMIAKSLSNGSFLPAQRNENKDTTEYMILINSKTQFMADSIERNPWNSTHFAWIDFSISYVFQEKDKTLILLRSLAKRTFQSTCFIIPGCWPKFNNEYISHITDTIFWRFCGGFFLGDAASVLQFHQLYVLHFRHFIFKYNKLVWEVNFWAWLESIDCDWNPSWYIADHNDSILFIPPEFFSQVLIESGAKHCQYDYKDIDGYYPSSASYVYYKGQHILNTRYTNYWLNPEGYYVYLDGTNVIRTKNIYSELCFEEDADGEPVLIPENYIEMVEDISLPEQNWHSRNVEDMRIYVNNHKVKFIGTTVGYHNTGGNRMIVGEYDIDHLQYKEECIVEPPENTWCEKNWIPLISRKNAEEYFIYRWEPFEIGQIVSDAETNQHRLNIVKTYDDTKYVPFFHKLRGSTPFIETTEGLVGVVHFSEETQPRHYFHMLVLLDKNTFQPLKYSEPFVFEKVAIEFCIGFDIRNGKYWFWISRFDRDPLMVYLETAKIPLVNKF
jgi:predicted GH43/DUF377 family glycosyl hydrolase